MKSTNRALMLEGETCICYDIINANPLHVLVRIMKGERLMKTRKRGFQRTMVSALAIFMALTLAAPAALAKGYELDNFAGPDNLAYGGKFYSEFSSLDEVFEAAKNSISVD